jgi:nuclear pore complex protein Nup155
MISVQRNVKADETLLLYADYVDQANYFDLALLIYNLADYRNAADIRRVWNNEVKQAHENAVQSGNATPREAVAEEVRDLGQKLKRSVSTFPVRKCFAYSNTLCIG